MTPDDYIADLEEPRRGEIQELHDLIRETVPDLESHVASGMLAGVQLRQAMAGHRDNAGGGTRTPKPLPAPAPKTGASASSATPACGYQSAALAAWRL